MIKLFSLKEEKAKEVTNGAASNPKIPPGLIRMQKGEFRCRRLPPRALLGPRLRAGGGVGFLACVCRGWALCARQPHTLWRLPARRHE